jgi:uncharacterized membrane protein YdjX (TVP38/TMEM64 family)
MPAVRRAKIAAVGLAVAIVVTAERLGLFHLTSDPVRLKQALLDLGPWGYVAFLVSYTVLQPFGVPGTVFVLAAPLIWPWPIAFALSMIGTLGASVVGFSFARFVARDWVARRIPARFHAYDEALARRAFATVFTLRLVFWMPQVLHAFFGISRVRFSTHFWGSAAGYVLPLLAMSYFGPKVFDAMRAAPPEVWAGVAVGAALIAATAWAIRRRRAGALARAAEPVPPV